jgi:branched-chain amino acid transport system permease protein
MKALSRLRLSDPSLPALALLIVAGVLITDEYILNLMIVSLFFGAQAMVFDFTAGFIGIVNFGFAAFLGLGAYVSALSAIRLGLSPWLTMWLGACVAGIVGWLTAILTLRLSGIFATVMSWFVGLTLLSLATALVPLTRGSLGLSVPPLLDAAERRPFFFALLPLAVLIYAVLRAVTRSRLGLAFRAIGDNVEAARASGINPSRCRSLNFTISCFFAGLLGGFYGHFVGVLTPEIMATTHTVEVLALAYIGGRGSLWGGLAAAFLVIPIFEFLKPLFEIRLVIYGLLLIAVMIYAPDGLAGRWARLRQVA